MMRNNDINDPENFPELEDDGFDFIFDNNDDFILRAYNSDSETNYDDSSDVETIIIEDGFGVRTARRYSGTSSIATRASAITHTNNFNNSPVVGQGSRNDTGLGDSLLESNYGGAEESLDDLGLDVVDGHVADADLSIRVNVSTVDPADLSHSQESIQGQAQVEEIGNNANANAGPSRTQTWVDRNTDDNSSTSDTDADVEDNADEDPTNLITAKYTEFINLCRQKLFDPELVFGDPGNMYDILEHEAPIDKIIEMLQLNNIPEALMEMIHFAWSQEEGAEEEESEGRRKNSQRILLRALTCAFPGNFDLEDASAVEKLLDYNIFEDLPYFVPVNLCQGLKNPSKKYHVYEHVQDYMNNLIQLTLQCRRVIFEFNPQIIQGVIHEVNIEKTLQLSLEKEARYTEELYQILRTLVSDRCQKFLQSRGFDIVPPTVVVETGTLMSQEDPQSQNSEEMNNRYSQSSTGNSGRQYLYNSGSGNNNPLGYHDNSQPENDYGQPFRELFASPANSQGSQQGSSQSSLQTLSNGEPSGIAEESYDYGRASQDSIENQGYASSSPHNSQYSSGSQSQAVPRLSQSPRASDSEPEMLRYDWQSTSSVHLQLVRPHSSSDSEGSQGPSVPKRPRQDYYRH